MQSAGLHYGASLCRSFVAFALFFAFTGGVHADDAQTLIAGGDFSYPPYEYLDEQGNPRGFNVALLRAIARDRDMDVRFALGPWERQRQQLETARIQVLPMFISEYRDQRVDFTQPFLIVNHEIFVRRGEVTPAGLGDLAGLQVIVEADAYAHDYLKLHGNAELLLVKSEAAAMQLLAAGGGDVAILGELRGRRMLEDGQFGNVTTSGPPVLPVPYAFAVPEGRDRLREQLNAGLANVKASGEFNRIYSRWLALGNWSGLLRYLAWLAVFAALAAMLALAWIRSLRRQVEQRTRALGESEQRFRATFEHAAIGMAWLSSGGRWIAVNAALCRMMGMHGETLKRTSLRTILSREYVGECIRKVRELRAGRLASFTAEMPFQRQEGMPGWASVHVSLSDRYPGAGPLGYIAVIEDVTEARRLSEQLLYHRTHDALTGLLNRQEFDERLQAVLDPGGDARHVLCHLDLDQFRLINDACGHAAGDELLRRIGAQLSSLMRAGDLLGRVGADRFAVLLRQCTLERGVRIAESLRQAVDGQDFDRDGQRFRVSVSIGVASIRAEDGTPASAFSAAGIACHVAKEQGGNRVHVFAEGDREMARRRGEAHWVSRLKTAIDENRFELYRQDIAPLQSVEEGQHFEVLLRLREGRDKLVLPGKFLPAAERYFLAGALDRWVVENVLSWLAANPREVERLAMCSINLSGQSVGDAGFHRFLEDLLDRHAIPPRKLCFEITETAAVGNIGRAVEFARKLKQRGCRFALDDFGIGMSSFAYLKSLPVDFLKIDGMFIRELTSNPLDKAIVRAISSVGHALDKRTVAEYVETRQVLEAVRDLGIDYAQGFAIARPRPLVTAGEIRERADAV